MLRGHPRPLPWEEKDSLWATTNTRRYTDINSAKIQLDWNEVLNQSPSSQANGCFRVHHFRKS